MRGGTLLLDPSAITLVAAGGTLDGELNGSADPSILFADGGANTTLSVSRLTSGFTGGDTITLQATGNITFGEAVTLQAGVNLGLNAGNQICITSPLDTSGGNLSLTSGSGSTLSASVTTNALTAAGGSIGYTSLDIPPFEKIYPPEDFNPADYIANPERAVFIAYLDGQPGS